MRRRVLLKSTPMGLPKSMLLLFSLVKSAIEKCTFKSRISKVESITIKKNGDYKSLPF